MYLRGIPFLRNSHSVHTLEEPKYKLDSIKSGQERTISIPFAREYHCKNEEMQGAWLVQTWHRAQPVSHGTGLLTWDLPQTYSPNTVKYIKSYKRTYQ